MRGGPLFLWGLFVMVVYNMLFLCCFCVAFVLLWPSSTGAAPNGLGLGTIGRGVSVSYIV
jgi:hypothetical protein